MHPEDSFLREYLGGLFDETLLRQKVEELFRTRTEKRRAAWGELSSESLRRLSILLLYYGTDLRVQEICELRVEDLFKEPSAPLKLRVVSPDGVSRIVVVDEELEEVLTGYVKAHGRIGGPLFLDSRGRRLVPRDVHRLLASYLNRAMLHEIGYHFNIRRRADAAVLPVPLRLNAYPGYTGRGVTFAFIDSGFYPHPDIMRPRRVLAFKNVGDPDGRREDFEKPDENSWHGMQTSVCAAGNGCLSDGLYRGIASDANLVLVQVRGRKGITYQSIVRGFEWVIKKRERYGIRILNVSLGTSSEESFYESPIDGLAEDAVQAGIVVLVAAGNEGHIAELNKITPPASAPSVITVGGLNDRNSLSIEDIVPYHSNYGETVDGVVKPEIVAPGILIAAPILPGSPLFQQARILWELQHEESDSAFREALEKELPRLDFPRDVLDLPVEEQRRVVAERIAREKIIHPHYQHVDGTSFSAPIVGSIVAQMLEANPALTPQHVKEILIETAVRVPGIPRERQGYGMVDPRAAVERALKKRIYVSWARPAYPRVEGNRVRFVFRSPYASSVSVAGSFNGWNPHSHPMERRGREYWELETVVPEPGRYFYKFVVDGHSWTHDLENPRLVPDGFFGFNSVFEIHSFMDTHQRLERVRMDLEEWNAAAVLRWPSDTGGEGALELDALRRDALGRLDELLKLPSISGCEEMKNYFVSRWAALNEDLAGPPPPEGRVDVHLLYNMGVIVRSARMTVGFDLVSTRHVLGVYWKVDDSLLEALVSAVDMVFYSHRHADHLDLDLAARFIRRGIPVVAPKEILDLIPKGSMGMEAGETRELFGMGRNNAAVRVKAHLASHLRGRATVVRCFEVWIEDEVGVFHASDADPFKSPTPSPDVPVDVFVACTPAVRREVVREIEDSTRGCVILAHLAEVGHRLDMGRPCWLDGLETAAWFSPGKALVPIWGERVEVELPAE